MSEDKSNIKLVAGSVHNISNRLSKFTDILCRLDVDEIANEINFTISHTSKVEELKKDKEPENALLSVKLSSTCNENLFNLFARTNGRDEDFINRMESAVETYYLHEVIHKMGCHPVAMNTACEFIANNVPGFRQEEDNVITKKKTIKVIRTMLETVISGKNISDKLKVEKRSLEYRDYEMVGYEELVSVEFEAITFNYKGAPFTLDIQDKHIIDIKQGEYR